MAQHGSIGTRALRVSLWLAVFVSLSQFVPDVGLRIFCTGKSAGTIMLAMPALFLLSFVPMAAAAEVGFANNRDRMSRQSFAAFGLLTIVVVLGYSYWEPFVYLTQMHPSGYAAFRVLTRVVGGAILTGLFYWVWSGKMSRGHEPASGNGLLDGAKAI